MHYSNKAKQIEIEIKVQVN